MASLSELPTELLVCIFKELDDLDDVVHLERCCQRLHRILEHGRNRLEVFRSVIIHAEHHKYDIQLCYFIEANQQYASNYIYNARPPMSCRPQSSVFLRLYDGSTNILTDELVWWIACRWQGLRVLQDLYAHPSVQTSFCHSVFPSCDDNASKATCDLLAAEGPLSQPSLDSETLLARPVAPFSSRQTQRLYQALTALWFAVEALCLARVSVYPTVSEQLKIFNYVTAIWEDNRKRTMSESLDILETYDFVWGFLGRKIFPDVQDFRSWTDVEGANFELGQESESESWDFFVKFTLQYLRPPNIIELLLLWAWDGSWPPNQPYYLRQLGHSDQIEGVVLVHDIGLSPDTYYSVASIEADALQRARELDSHFHTNITDTLKKYRETRWASIARGRVFTWEEQDIWIIKHVMAGYS